MELFHFFFWCFYNLFCVLGCGIFCRCFCWVEFMFFDVWLLMSFNYDISQFILSPDDLSTRESGVLKSSTIYEVIFIDQFNSISCLLWTEVILFRISIVAIKMGRKGFVLLRCSHCSQSSKKVRAEIWRQELKHRPWWIGAYCIASHVLFILLSFATQNALLRGGTVLNDLDPPTSISNQDNTLQTSLQASLMQVFSQLRVLISKWL